MIVYVLLSNMIFLNVAYAYIDPATGGFLIQALVASLIGVGIFFKNIKSKIKSIFSKNRDGKTKDK